MSITYALNNLKDKLPYALLGAAIASPRLAGKMAEIVFRVGYIAIGEQIRTGSGSAKIIYEVITRKPGVKRPPLIPPADKVAIRAAAGRAATIGRLQTARTGAAALTLLTNPAVVTTVGVVGGSYLAGSAVGSSKAVRTAPPERGQPGLMMGVW